MKHSAPIAAYTTCMRTITLALLILAAGACFSTAAGAWQTQIVDGSAPNGQGLAITAQGRGRVHISYQNTVTHKLMYATNTYGAAPWTKQEVGPAADNLAQRNAIAVDSDGSLHITCSNPFNHDIRYATDATGAWQTQGLSLGIADPSNAITVDADDHIHIVAVNESKLQYATDATGSLVVTALKDASNADILAGRADAILVSSTGKVYIIHTSGANLCLTTNASGAWVQEPIGPSGNLELPAAAAFDNNGFLHVTWLGTGNALQYATNASGAWNVTTVDTLTASAGFSARITAAAAGNVQIYYYDPGNTGIRRADYDGTTWTVQPNFCTVANVANSAITVEPNGAIWLAYFDATANLKVTTTNPADPHGADLAITQTASPDNPNPVYTNSGVTFTVTVTNKGPAKATGVIVTDKIPAGTTFVSATPSAGTASHAAGTVTWTLGDLPAGQSKTLKIVVKMPATAGTVSNKATVTSDAGNDAADPNDFKSNNDSAAKALTVQTLPVQMYTLSFQIADNTGGTAAAANGQASQPGGTVVPVKATPDQHYRVKQWTGTLHDSWKTNDNEVQMGNQNKAVEVTFERIPHYLTTAVVGGHGKLLPLSGYQGEGTTVTLTAIPDPHYKVKKWTGTNDDTSLEKVNAITITCDATVTVEFHGLFNDPPHSRPGTESGETVFFSGVPVTLDGTYSTDPEGRPLTYSWKQVGGPAVTLSNPADLKPTFTTPSVTEERILAFRLTVTDDMGLEDWATLEIKVNKEITELTWPCPFGVGPGNVILFGSLYCLGLFSVKWTRRQRVRP